MNRIELVVGDWSCDGHEKNDHYMIDTEFTAKDIEKAYKKGCKIVGFDLMEFCNEYEDPELPREQCDLLAKSGFDLETNLIGYSDLKDGELEGIVLTSEEYLDIYLFFAKLGNPNFVYTLIIPDYQNRLNIGGYGLFQ